MLKLFISVEKNCKMIVVCGVVGHFHFVFFRINWLIVIFEEIYQFVADLHDFTTTYPLLETDDGSVVIDDSLMPCSDVVEIFEYAA